MCCVCAGRNVRCEKIKMKQTKTHSSVEFNFSNHKKLQIVIFVTKSVTFHHHFVELSRKLSSSCIIVTIMTAETRIIGTKSKISCTTSRKHLFHEKYLKLCKTRNIAPVSEVKGKKGRKSVELDFHCDRLRPAEWHVIIEALHNDKSLRTIAIRLRKNQLKGQQLRSKTIFPINFSLSFSLF